MTARTGDEGEFAAYVDSTDLEQPMATTRENRERVRAALHGCFGLGPE